MSLPVLSIFLAFLFSPLISKSREEWKERYREDVVQLQLQSDQARENLGPNLLGLIGPSTASSRKRSTNGSFVPNDPSVPNDEVDSILEANRGFSRTRLQETPWLLECVVTAFEDPTLDAAENDTKEDDWKRWAIVWDAVLPEDQLSLRLEDCVYLSRQCTKAEQLGWIGWEIGRFQRHRTDASTPIVPSDSVENSPLESSAVLQKDTAPGWELQPWVVAASLGRQRLLLAHRHYEATHPCPISFSYITRLWDLPYVPAAWLREIYHSVEPMTHASRIHHPTFTAASVIGRSRGYLFARVGIGNFGANFGCSFYPDDSTDLLVLRIKNEDLLAAFAPDAFARDWQKGPQPPDQQLAIEFARVLGYHYGFFLPCMESTDFSMLYAVFPVSHFGKETGIEPQEILNWLKHISRTPDSSIRPLSHPSHALSTEYIQSHPEISYAFLEREIGTETGERLSLIRPRYRLGTPRPVGNIGARPR